GLVLKEQIRDVRLNENHISTTRNDTLEDQAVIRVLRQRHATRVRVIGVGDDIRHLSVDGGYPHISNVDEIELPVKPPIIRSDINADAAPKERLGEVGELAARCIRPY